MATLEWGTNYKKKHAVRRRYPSIWKLPIVKRPHSLLARLPHSSSVLELGAGNRSFGERVAKHWPGATYKSFDIDQSRHHDFYSLEDIEGQYDTIVMQEVIEHLTSEVAFQSLQVAFERLNSGGHILISTPNIYYPPEFLRDITHITPWSYDELGAAVLLSGFELVSLHRCYHESLFKKLVRRVICYPLFRLLKIDFAHHIVAIGSKP